MQDAQIVAEEGFLDFHTHQPRHLGQPQVAEVVSVRWGESPLGSGWFTAGLHPWWASDWQPGQLDWLRHWAAQPGCLALGEMGLDKLKGPGRALQLEVFRQQLCLAEELGMPVVIHCVRAYHQLMQLKKAFPRISRWCLHGFARQPALARQLVGQGFYLSLMPTTSAKYAALLGALPADRVFLETDSLAGADIVDIYHQVASVTGQQVRAWQGQIARNAAAFFAQKSGQ